MIFYILSLLKISNFFCIFSLTSLLYWVPSDNIVIKQTGTGHNRPTNKGCLTLWDITCLVLFFGRLLHPCPSHVTFECYRYLTLWLKDTHQVIHFFYGYTRDYLLHLVETESKMWNNHFVVWLKSTAFWQKKPNLNKWHCLKTGFKKTQLLSSPSCFDWSQNFWSSSWVFNVCVDVIMMCSSVRACLTAASQFLSQCCPLLVVECITAVGRRATRPIPARSHKPLITLIPSNSKHALPFESGTFRSPDWDLSAQEPESQFVYSLIQGLCYGSVDVDQQ